MPEIGRPAVHDHSGAPGGGTIAHSATTGKTATDHHTAAILASLLTTRGDTIIRGASAPARLAVGAANEVLSSDGTDPSWAAAGAGAVTREGGNTTEATTTSTSAVDLLTAASLTLAALQPFYAVAALRRTSGAIAAASVGLKLNSTAVRSAQTWDSANDNNKPGWVIYQGGPRLTSYTLTGNMSFGSGLDLSSNMLPWTVAAPTVEITALIVTAKVSDGDITMGADELHVYSFATS